MRAIKERIGVDNVTLNESENEIGYWRDKSSDRSNFEDWQWYCISMDENKIKAMKAIKVIEEYINEVLKY